MYRCRVDTIGMLRATVRVKARIKFGVADGNTQFGSVLVA